MFEAAMSKFVKTVGGESLIAVPSIYQANDCKNLQVVVKKNRRWSWWQSPRYIPTPFQLTQLLTDESPLDDVTATSSNLLSYNKTYKFSLDGKVGAKLKDLVDIDITASGLVEVEANLGDITSERLPLPELVNAVSTRILDMKNEEIKQIRQDPNKTLCVIVGVASLAKSCSLHMHTDLKASEKVTGNCDTTATGNENTDIDRDNNKTLGLQAGTPLAYSVCELKVAADGKLTLLTVPEAIGGFEGDVVDALDAVELEENLPLEEQYSALLALDQSERKHIRKAVLSLCATPSEIEAANKMLKTATRFVEGDSETSSVTMATVQDKKHVKTILTLAGATVQGDSVTLPTANSPMLESLTALFAALMELDDDATVALAKVNANLTPGLLYMLSETLDNESVALSDTNIQDIYKHANPTQDFIKLLGFYIVDAKSLIASENNHHELEGAYRSVYALWGTVEGIHLNTSSAWRCALL